LSIKTHPIQNFVGESRKKTRFQFPDFFCLTEIEQRSLADGELTSFLQTSRPSCI